MGSRIQFLKEVQTDGENLLLKMDREDILCDELQKKIKVLINEIKELEIESIQKSYDKKLGTSLKRYELCYTYFFHCYTKGEDIIKHGIKWIERVEEYIDRYSKMYRE